MKKSVSYFMLGCIFISCLSEADCIITYSNEIILNIKSSVDGTSKTVLFQSVTLEGTGLVFYENVSTNQLKLPVDPQGDKVVINLDFEGKNEILEFSYINTPQLISPDCGAYSFIQDLNATSFTISNVSIVNSVLSTSATVNAEIFI
ncbi:MAG: hypothetical protein HC811_01220 [Flammeovirgaceae bacterium]|nr:hypothetical protein [Flammeovirgaceae bacterium]